MPVILKFFAPLTTVLLDFGSAYRLQTARFRSTSGFDLLLECLKSIRCHEKVMFSSVCPRNISSLIRFQIVFAATSGHMTCRHITVHATGPSFSPVAHLTLTNTVRMEFRVDYQ
ncbi:hypothetical protein BDZ88DRAFT_431432 [Geranomyces variabilis]|nr:hypothetical protein BDZ88DRAFT_431432 [Geranomyces variabilis]